MSLVLLTLMTVTLMTVESLRLYEQRKLWQSGTSDSIDWPPDSVLPTKTTSWGYNYLHLLSFSEPFDTNHCFSFSFFKAHLPFLRKPTTPSPLQEAWHVFLLTCTHLHYCTGMWPISSLQHLFQIQCFLLHSCTLYPYYTVVVKQPAWCFQTPVEVSSHVGFGRIWTDAGVRTVWWGSAGVQFFAAADHISTLTFVSRDHRQWRKKWNAKTRQNKYFQSALSMFCS